MHLRRATHSRSSLIPRSILTVILYVLFTMLSLNRCRYLYFRICILFAKLKHLPSGYPWNYRVYEKWCRKNFFKYVFKKKNAFIFSVDHDQKTHWPKKKYAEGRIRTGESLRKQILSLSPLTWLGNLRNAMEYEFRGFRAADLGYLIKKVQQLTNAWIVNFLNYIF